LVVDAEKGVVPEPGGHASVGVVQLGTERLEVPPRVGIQAETIEKLGAHRRPPLAIEEASPRVGPPRAGRAEHVPPTQRLVELLHHPQRVGPPVDLARFGQDQSSPRRRHDPKGDVGGRHLLAPPQPAQSLDGGQDLGAGGRAS
jgi:hypothetical protein